MPVRFWIAFALVLASCAAETSPLQDMADEGLGLIKAVHFSSPPEVKVQMAQDLLTHASKYDQLISRSPGLAYTAKAQGFQRQKREAAATLLRDAAADYAKRQTWRTHVLSNNPSSRASRKRTMVRSVEPPSPRSLN